MCSFPNSPRQSSTIRRGRARVNAAVQSAYARLAGTSVAALTVAMQSYLPVVQLLMLLGSAWPAQRERLIQRVEAGLQSDR